MLNVRCPHCDYKLRLRERRRLIKWINPKTGSCPDCGRPITWDRKAFGWIQFGYLLLMIAYAAQIILIAITFDLSYSSTPALDLGAYESISSRASSVLE